MGIEIINGAFDVYMAPVDEAYTDLSQTPAGNWAKIGTSGKRHYGEDGVVLTVNQETANHAFAGGTGGISGLEASAGAASIRHP